MPERVAMPITPVPLPPLRTQGLTSEQFVAQFEAFMLAFYQSVQDYNAAASAFQLSVTATSTTSNSIGTGSRTFTVPSGLGFVTGMALRAANSGTNFMTGDVVSYSGTTLVLNVTSATGAVGPHTSWTISQAAVGANSAGSISNAPSGNISATNVQAAINELDSEKLSSAPGGVTGTNLENVVTGGTAGSATSVPVVTFDVKGRITGMTTAQVAGLGIGQTWQDVTATRAKNTTYTNTTGRPIAFSVRATRSGVGDILYLFTSDFIRAMGANQNSTILPSDVTAWVIVFPGETYRAEVGGTIASWTELRG